MENKLFTGCSHVGIYVLDREKSIKFYEEVLGFKLLYRVDVESDGLLIAMLQLGNCAIEVLQPPKETGVLPKQCAQDNIIPSARSTPNHFAVTVSDIDKAMERVISFGYKFEDRIAYDVPCFGSADLDLRVAFFRGPDGERIELFQETRK